MKKKKIAIVVGTRPEAIKMAPVCFALAGSSGFLPVLVSTGQHREMLDQALSAFGLSPQHDLALMRPNQSLPELTARVLEAMTAWLAAEQPAAVLVQGDTTTSLSAALASFYARIPLGHVEAGLRTYNLEAPWPEEMNRRLTDPISRWCFAPTEIARENLLRENIAGERVTVTGNTVVDALLWMREKQRSATEDPVHKALGLGVAGPFAEAHFGSAPRRWLLVTGHRRESFGQGFENICLALQQLVERHADLGVLYPVHLNPNVQQPVRRILGYHPRVALIPPLAYEDFVWCMDRCHFIISDSGGVQEEAPSLGKPVLVMRETTERPEGVAAGTCTLVGTDPERILAESHRLLTDPAEYARRSALKNPYGDGDAAERIVRILEADIGA